MTLRKLTATASVVTLSMMMAGAAYANCDTSLRDVDQNLDQQARAGFGTAAQDIRRLRNSASLLADYGKADACAQVMAAIKEIAQKPEYQRRDTSLARDRQNYAERAGAQENVSRKEKAAQAKPVLDARGQFSVEEMNGATIYSSKTGNSLGEIEDVILAGEGKQFAVLAHGGFLGMGEKRVKVGLSDIKVNRNDNTYYVPLTAEALEAAPDTEWRNGQWSGSVVQADAGAGDQSAATGSAAGSADERKQQ